MWGIVGNFSWFAKSHVTKKNISIMIWRETVKNICNVTLLRSIPMPEVMAGKTVLVSGHASLRAISKLLEEGNSLFSVEKNGMYLQDEGASFRSKHSKFPERMIDYVGKNIWKSVSFFGREQNPFPTLREWSSNSAAGFARWQGRTVSVWQKSTVDSGAKEAKYNWCQMILSFRRV